MIVSIEHRTVYRYEGLASFGDHHLYLRPRDSYALRVSRFEVVTDPPAQQRWVRDAFGNLVLVTNFGLIQSRTLSFETSIEVEMEEDNPFNFILEPYATGYPFRYSEHDGHALCPYLAKSEKEGARVLDWFYRHADNPNHCPDIIRFLTGINEAIYRNIAYERREEEGIRSPAETISLARGSCRDLATLFVAICRELNLAARFVSGYLYNPPLNADSAETVLDNRAEGAMHAWAEVYLPGAGWRGYDPTNGVLANQFFIPSAVTSDPATVNPIQGRFFAKRPLASELEVSLRLQAVPAEIKGLS